MVVEGVRLCLHWILVCGEAHSLTFFTTFFLFCYVYLTSNCLTSKTSKLFWLISWRYIRTFIQDRWFSIFTRASYSSHKVNENWSLKLSTKWTRVEFSVSICITSILNLIMRARGSLQPFVYLFKETFSLSGKRIVARFCLMRINVACF